MPDLDRRIKSLMIVCAASIMTGCVLARWLQAQEAEGAAVEIESKPAEFKPVETKPASDKPPVISARDGQELSKHVDKEVIARGIVATTRSSGQNLVLYFSDEPGGFAVAIPLAKVGKVISSVSAAGGKLRGSILDVRGVIKRNEPLGTPIIFYSDSVSIAPAPAGAKIPGVDPGVEPDANSGPRIVIPTKPQRPFADELQRALSMFKSKLWPYRAFAVLRMDGYKGEQKVIEVIKLGLTDKDWHVRCFAVWALARHRLDLPKGALLRETDPRVIRLALRMGLGLPNVLISRHVRANVRKRSIEDRLLGIEIAAASDIESLKKDAWKRLVILIGTMDDRAAVLIGHRLNVLLLNGALEQVLKGAAGEPGAAAQLRSARNAAFEGSFWKQWIQKNIKSGFPEQDISKAVRDSDGPLVSKVSWEAFDEHTRYLEFLSKQNIEVSIVMDGTGSMDWVLKRAQAGVDRLILILNDLSQEMRLGVVIYRDTTDTKPVEAFRMSKDILSVRSFLVTVQAGGGGDLPESVILGLEACELLGWKRAADHIVVVIGDAPSREENEDRIEKQVLRLREYGARVHAINVGRSPLTSAAFARIAKLGKGKSVMLDQNLEVAKEVLRLTLDESVQPAFDDFYEMYVKLCF